MAVDNSCTSAQTFCALNRQIVSKNNELIFSYDGCITAKEIIEEDTWNELIAAIVNVYNYGVRGTRNPKSPLQMAASVTLSNSTTGNETAPTNRISNETRNSKFKNEGELITITDYNAILSTIGATTLPEPSMDSEKPIIYGSYFKDVMDQLNSYQLDNTRCNNCNAGCNVTCQASRQCCDSHCCTECCTNACAYTCEAHYDACTHGLYNG